MIKKLKLGLLALAILAVFGVASYANAQALNFDSIVTVTIGSHDYSIDSNSEATEVIVGTTNITIEVPAASTTVFGSPERFDLDNDGGLTQTCGDGFSYLTITGAATVVITPDTTNVCEGGGSGGSGGGGGGTTKPKTTTTTTTTTPSTTVGGGGGTYDFGGTTLKNGSTGDGVMELQSFLNASLGLSLAVDGAMGPMTVAAVIQWQTANGLVPDGLVGPMTKAAMNAVAPAAPSAPVAPAVPSMPSASASGLGTATLKVGSSGESVKVLQALLNSALGLSLSVDGQFGPMTSAAVKQWQTANGLVPDGLVGPMTKAAMNAPAQ